MTKPVISPEEGAELAKLRVEHLRANNYATEMLQKYGMDSPQFAEADKIAGEISVRIKTILGDADKPWNA